MLTMLKVTYFYISFIINLIYIESVKVKEWFGGSYPTDVSCRVLALDLGFLNLQKPKNAIERGMDNLFKYALREINCTYVYSPATIRIIDRPDENGTYNGVIGMIQRNEYDLALFPLRTDLIFGDPVKLGPAIASGDSLIITGTSNDTADALSIESFVSSFSGEVYLYYLISMHIVLVIIVGTIYVLQPYLKKGTFHHKMGKNNRNVSLFFIRYFYTLRKLVMCLLGSESLEPVTSAIRVLGISILFTNYFLIEGFFKNLIKAESLSVRPAQLINSLEDLVNNTNFKSVLPIFLHQLYLSTLLEDEKFNLPIYQLLRKRISQHSSILLDFSKPLVAVDQVKKAIDDVIDNHAALIIPVSLDKDHMFDKFFCPSDPAKSLRIRIANKPILSGCTLNMFYSKQVDSRIQNLANYKYTSFMEFGSLYAFSKLVQTSTSVLEGMPFSGEHARCSLGITKLKVKERKREQIVRFEQINFTFLSPLMRFMLFVYIIIFSIFIVEFSFNKRRSKKRRTIN